MDKNLFEQLEVPTPPYPVRRYVAKLAMAEVPSDPVLDLEQELAVPAPVALPENPLEELVQEPVILEVGPPSQEQSDPLEEIASLVEDAVVDIGQSGAAGKEKVAGAPAIPDATPDVLKIDATNKAAVSAQIGAVVAEGAGKVAAALGEKFGTSELEQANTAIAAAVAAYGPDSPQAKSEREKYKPVIVASLRSKMGSSRKSGLLTVEGPDGEERAVSQEQQERIQRDLKEALEGGWTLKSIGGKDVLYKVGADGVERTRLLSDGPETHSVSAKSEQVVVPEVILETEAVAPVVAPEAPRKSETLKDLEAGREQLLEVIKDAQAEGRGKRAAVVLEILSLVEDRIKARRATEQTNKPNEAKAVGAKEEVSPRAFEKTLGHKTQDALNEYRNALDNPKATAKDVTVAKKAYLQLNNELESSRKGKGGNEPTPAQPVGRSPRMNLLDSLDLSRLKPNEVGSQTERRGPSPEIDRARAAAENTESIRVRDLENKVAELERRLADKSEQPPAPPRGLENPSPTEGEPGEPQPGDAERALREVGDVGGMGEDKEIGWLEREGMLWEAARHDTNAWWQSVWAKRAQGSLARRESKVKDLENKAKEASNSAWGTFTNPFKYGWRINYHRWREGLVRAAYEQHDDARARYENGRNEVFNLITDRMETALKTREARAEEAAARSEIIDNEMDALDADLEQVNTAIAQERDDDVKEVLLEERNERWQKHKELADEREKYDALWQIENGEAARIQRIVNHIKKKANPGGRPDTTPVPRPKLVGRVKREPAKPRRLAA